jgi:hypothetical protein
MRRAINDLMEGEVLCMSAKEYCEDMGGTLDDFIMTEVYSDLNPENPKQELRDNSPKYSQAIVCYVPPEENNNCAKGIVLTPKTLTPFIYIYGFGTK